MGGQLDIKSDQSVASFSCRCVTLASTWICLPSNAESHASFNCVERWLAPACRAAGDSYKAIKNGEAVQNAAGVTVPAGLLCSPDKPGRKIVLLPACSNAQTIAPYAAGADVLYGNAAAAASSSISGVGSSGDLSNSGSAPQQQQQQPAGPELGRFAERCGVRTLVITGLPGEADVSSSNKWRAVGTTNNRPRGSSGDSSSSSNLSDGNQAEVAAPQQRLDPAVAAVLGVVSQQYTSGYVIPARDDFSLIVEENMGVLPSPPVDVAEKVAIARATTLNVMSITPPGKADRDSQRDLQWDQLQRVQDREAVKNGAYDRGDGSAGQNGSGEQQQQGFKRGHNRQQRLYQGGNWYSQGRGRRDGQNGDRQQGARVGRDGDRQQQSRTQQQQQHWQQRQQLEPARAADAREAVVTR